MIFDGSGDSTAYAVAPFVVAWSIMIGGRQAGGALVCGTGAEIRGDKGGAEAAAAAVLGRRVGSTCFASQPDASTASAFSPCK